MRQRQAHEEQETRALHHLPPNFMYLSENFAITRSKYGKMATLLDDAYVGQYIRSIGEWEDCIVSLLR